MTHSKFPSPANDYIEDRIDLNREFVPSPMSTEQLVVVGDAMSGTGLYDGDLVLFDRAKLPSQGRCVVALYEGEVIVRKIQGRPPRVALVATDGITAPIWFGQGSDSEILGTVTVGVHPSPDISLNGLAVSAHWSCPQATGWMDQRGDIFPETERFINVESYS